MRRLSNWRPPSRIPGDQGTLIGASCSRSTSCPWLHFLLFKLPHGGVSRLHSPSVGSALDYASTSCFLTALVPSYAQQPLCFATGLAFLYHFVLVTLLHTLGSNASGLAAVALLALLVGLMLEVPSAKADAAPTARTLSCVTTHVQLSSFVHLVMRSCIDQRDSNHKVSWCGDSCVFLT